MSFIKKKGVITKKKSITPKADLSAWYIDANTATSRCLKIYGAWLGNRANVTIIIAATAVAVVVSVVVFIRWPGAQETPCRRVLLGRLVVALLFRGGVVSFPGHVIVVIFIFQFPIEEELEVLTIGQGLVVLWPGPEVPLFYVPVQRSAYLISGLGVELRGHLLIGLRFSGGVGGIRGWGGHGKRRVNEMVQLLSAWGRKWMHGALMRD
jgi:hypothetical protein